MTRITNAWHNYSSSPSTELEPGYALEEWIVTVKGLSNDGQIVISNFEQVPRESNMQFGSVIRSVGFALRQFSGEGALAYRKIVEVHEPNLLANFDAHFGTIIEKIVANSDPSDQT